MQMTVESWCSEVHLGTIPLEANVDIHTCIPVQSSSEGAHHSGDASADSREKMCSKISKWQRRAVFNENRKPEADLFPWKQEEQ